MADKSALSLSFIDRQPVAAAAALSELERTDAAAFLDTIPTRYAVAVMGRMSSWATASILGHMTPVAAGAVIQHMPFPDIAATLRLLPRQMRDTLAEALPTALKRDLDVMLAFPADSVGAAMMPHMPTFEAHHEVRDALDALRSAPPSELDAVFITDSDCKYLGFVSLNTLVRHGEGSPLGNIMTRSSDALSSRARLASTVRHPAWQTHLVLPVVNRRKQVIGGLLRKAVSTTIDHSAHAIPGGSVMGALWDAVFESGIAMARLIVDVPPPEQGGGA